MLVSGLLAGILLTTMCSPAQAHTISIGYANTGSYEVTFWYGSYHDKLEASYNEGSLKLVGPGVDKTLPFNLLEYTKPAGLVDGQTNFYNDGGHLGGINNGQNVLSWQGREFSGITSGTYTFTYVPIASPTTVWAPRSDTILSGTLHIIVADIVSGAPRVKTGEVANQAPAHFPLILDGGMLKAIGDTTLNKKVSVASNSTINTNGNSLTIGTDIDGRADLTKTGSGTLFLTGSNTNTGDLVIADGIVNVSSDGPLGAGGVVIGGGALQVGSSFSIDNPITLTDSESTVDTQAHHLTLTQPIDGAGGLSKAGAGTLELTGVNSYAGPTDITEGALSLTGTGSIAASSEVIADGTFDISSLAGNADITTLSGNGTIQLGKNSLTLTAAAGTFDGTITGTGGIVIQSGREVLTGTNTYTGGTVVTAGTLIGNTDSLQGAIANNATLVFNQNGNGVFVGTMTGNGQLTKSGNGTLTLNKTNPFTGDIDVADGGLVIGDDAHPAASIGSFITVSESGWIGGQGQIGGLNVIGTVTPGNSIGTLHVNGDFTAGADSIFKVEVDAAGHSDQINITGKATIKGGLIKVEAADGNYLLQTDYTILQAADGVTGQYDNVSSNLPFLEPSLIYLDHSVQLRLIRNKVDFSAIAHTPNQWATANAVEALGRANPIYRKLVALDADSSRQAFDQLSGESFASVRSALLSDSRYLRSTLSGRLQPSCAADTGRGNRLCGSAFWARFRKTDTRRAGNGNTPALNRNSRGVVFGVDRQIAGFRLGLAANFTHAGSSTPARAASTLMDGYGLAVYAGNQWGRVGFSAGAAYGWHNLDSRRHVRFPSFDEQLTSNYDANIGQLFGELDYDFMIGSNQLSPFLRAAYEQLHTDAIKEDDGLAALQINGARSSVGVSTLGLRLGRVMGNGDTRTIKINAMVGWLHRYGDDRIPQTHSAFAGGPTFVVDGIALADDAVVVRAGLDARLTDALSLGASYAGQFADGVNANSIEARLIWRFQ